MFLDALAHIAARPQLFLFYYRLACQSMEAYARAAALAEEKPALEQLTPTERRVLKLIAEGQTSHEIAATLGIGIRSVEHHRNNITAKLELRGSHALVKFAIQHQEEL
jgi:DNA-binding CsgD family transcriptional regulator